ARSRRGAFGRGGCLAAGRGDRRDRPEQRERGPRRRRGRRVRRLGRGRRPRPRTRDARPGRCGACMGGSGSVSEQRTGKATAGVYEQVIVRRLGARDDDVLVGPRHGVDVGVVRVADGVAMAMTADPVFIVPAYGWERAAWFAVHILASDAATSGLPLRWMSVDLNLPPEITDDELTQLWDAFHRACEGLGVAVVTGHTARYDGCAWP